MAAVRQARVCARTRRSVQLGLLAALALGLLAKPGTAARRLSRSGGSDDDDDDGDSRPWQMSWEQQDVSHRAPTATCAAVGGGHPYGGVTTSQTVAAIDGNARNDAVAEYIRQHATDMLRNVRRKCEQVRALRYELWW